MYYNYDNDSTIPIPLVEDYVQQLLCIPIERLVQHNIDAQTVKAVTSNDIFRFGSLEVGTDYACQVVNNVENLGITIMEAGGLLLTDEKYIPTLCVKYSETYLRIAEIFDLLFDLSCIEF